MSAPLEYQPVQDDPRRFESPIARFIAWSVIVVCVAFVITAQYLPEIRGKKRTTGAGGTSAVMQQLQMEFSARYAVGLHTLFKNMQGGGGQDPVAQLIPQLRQLATTDADRFKVAITLGELRGADAALDELKTVHTNGTGVPPANPAATMPIDPFEGAPAPAAAAPASIKPDADDLRIVSQLYAAAAAAQAATQSTTSTSKPAPVKPAPSIAPEDREHLIARYGWFGKLAVSFGQSDADPTRSEVISKSIRTLIGLGGFVVVMGLGLLVGLGLLITAIVLITNGRIRFTGTARWLPAQPFLEVFAIYLPLFLLVSLALSALHLENMGWYLVTTPIILPIAWLWPRLRGMTARQASDALGWFTGRGVIREIGAGILGYIAGLPVVAVGFIVMFVLMKLSHAPTPSHPIIGEVQKLSPLMIYLVASVWAPLMEETFFRGALFHHMRTRWGWWPSALSVSLIFAMIHPQGWISIPLLGSIAMVLAAIREWRGSIIGPMVAHALTNFMTTTLLLTTMT